MNEYSFYNETYTDKGIHELFEQKQLLIQQLKNSNLGSDDNRHILLSIDNISNQINSIQTKSAQSNKSIMQSNGNNIQIPSTSSSYDFPEQNSVIQQGNSFLIENPDRAIGKNAKIDKGRIAIDSKDAPPGYMNPINVRTITQAISIDSRFRPNYYSTKSTDFDVILPSIQKNVVSMRVTSIEFPITWYAISQSSGNATCLIIDNDNNTRAWVLTLPDGNYEQSWARNSKAAYTEPAMNNAIINAVPVTITNTITGTVVINPSGSKLTANDLLYDLERASGKSKFLAVSTGILFSKGFTIRFNVDNSGNLSMDTIIQLRLGWQLGFRSAEYVATPNCISEGICLICGPRYGFISIDDHQKNTGPAYIIAYNNSIFQDNIITRINLGELLSDVGVYQESSDPGLSTQLNRTREYFGPVDIQRLHIAVYDEFGRIIDINNMDWSLTLIFEIVYN